MKNVNVLKLLYLRAAAKPVVRIALACAVALVVLPGILRADTDPDSKANAVQVARQGMKLMDAGKYEEALVLLDSAARIDPDNIYFPYEKAYTYTAMKRYSDAVEIIESVIDRSNATDEFYQLLGSCYDYMEETERALEIYNDGLERFPKSGRLYSEIGITYLRGEKVGKALESFEKGIAADPAFASNYYYAAIIFAETDEKIWSLFYGEIFLNIERGSKRSYEMSKLLYDVYTNSLTVTDTSGSVRLSKLSNQISLEELQNPDGFKPRFEMAFELNMSAALGVTAAGKSCAKQPLPISCLARVRSLFISHWGDNREKYPNALLDWHKTLLDKDYFTVYSYWLLNQGDTEEAKQWFTENDSKFKEFVQWFGKNPIPLSQDTYMVRTQYDRK